MDIRQVKQTHPKLGELADTRFRIIHNIRTLTEHEFTVAQYLVKEGAQKVSTKNHLYILSTTDGQHVDVTITEPKQEGLPFLTFPACVRLFCIEIGNLHTNQMGFVEKAEDEILQIQAELRDLAQDGSLFVEQGKHIIQIKEQGNTISFQTPNKYA